MKNIVLKKNQGKKEKECLKIKETEKLIDEKEELNKVISQLKKQIEEAKSNETEKKTKLTEEKTTKETRLITIKNQIDKYVTKQYVREDLKRISSQLKVSFLNEEITTKLKALQTFKENALKTLESN
ncbi:hypothetical protein [Candidatus Phytoplasma oryzae]|nr:hypothetical protein PIE28_01945 [Candidatus Phytoplasma oryzae]